MIEELYTIDMTKEEKFDFLCRIFEDIETLALNVVPAYGRDYKFSEEVKKDWENGKDFLIRDALCKWNGSYISIRDTRKDTFNWEVVKITFNRGTQACLVTESL
tara:strand:+ start:877 stop:1188 length:312 start_codon:yes stop_codon:yes gene_type:complete